MSNYISVSDYNLAIGKLGDMAALTSCSFNEMTERIVELEKAVSHLRSVLDAETEKPNRKSDLEIFSRIVPSEDFLKLEGNIFLD